jgi:hypothetical protein
VQRPGRPPGTFSRAARFLYFSRAMVERTASTIFRARPNP